MGCKQSKSSRGAVDGVWDTPYPYKNDPSNPNMNKEAGVGSSTTYDTSDLPPVITTSRSDMAQNGEEDEQQSQHLPKPPPNIHRTTSGGSNSVLYDLLMDVARGTTSVVSLWSRVIGLCETNPQSVSFVHPETSLSPLHLACNLIDYHDEGSRNDVEVDGGDDDDEEEKEKEQHVSQEPPAKVDAAVRALIQVYPEAASRVDSHGCIPLHYAISSHLPSNFGSSGMTRMWKERAAIVKLLVASDYDVSIDYLSRNDVVFDVANGNLGVCGGRTPLYNAIESLPDDFAVNGPTVQFVKAVHESNPFVVTVRNASDGDTPLALLYRRYTRQFDLSEKYFPGDNSRREVMEHRREYKTSAANTWSIIDTLLRDEDDYNHEEIKQEDDDGGDDEKDETNTEIRTNTKTSRKKWNIVHGTVQTNVPQDLLRYIIETHGDDVRTQDDKENLPLHYAAKSHGASSGNSLELGADAASSSSLPAFYGKFVIDELLYKYSDGASVLDGEGRYPLTLAIEAGKKYIGGGVKSLYEACPDAIEQVNLQDYPLIRHAMSFADYDDEDGGPSPMSETGAADDEHDDAIMLVQDARTNVVDVASAMWAHEEDAGVQMLGCLAITKLAEAAADKDGKGNDGSDIFDNDFDEDVLRVALAAVPAVVNAMRAHPNEPAVQEKACSALRALASADGKRELSFVACGAISAAVAAMQAHVADAIVQEEACRAISNIVQRGGSERATIVASASGLTAIVNALGAHPNVCGVQREACRALEVLTSYPDANLPELPRGQTAPLLQGAKRRFPEECEHSADAVLSRLS